MTLARGDDPAAGTTEDDVARSPAVVIAVAPTAADRVRIADAVGGAAPVLLVGSVREAVLLLLRDPSVDALLDSALDQPPGLSLAAVPDEDPTPPTSGLVVDSDARIVACGERRADLTPLEHDLLVSLQRADGHLRTFAWLQWHVWHNDHQGGRSHVQSAVKRLRRKLTAIESPVQIEGVRGIGLRLVPADPGRESWAGR